jgi:hypothetical protein
MRYAGIPSMLILLLFTALSPLSFCPSTIESSSVTQVEPVQQLNQLIQEYKDAEKQFHKQSEPLPDNADGQKKYDQLFKEYDQKQNLRFEKVLKLAQDAPSSDAGFTALEWLLTLPRAYFVPVGKPAMELAAQHHAANPKIGKSIAWLGYYFPDRAPSDPAAKALIQAVYEQNPDKTARAQAALGLALLTKSEFASADFKHAANVSQLESATELAFEKLIADFGDCPRLIRPNAGTVGEFAKSELFELRHLRIGKLAPEIEGEDLEGKKFKLSDYRGKVVMLDFWGDW